MKKRSEYLGKNKILCLINFDKYEEYPITPYLVTFEWKDTKYFGERYEVVESYYSANITDAWDVDIYMEDAYGKFPWAQDEISICPFRVTKKLVVDILEKDIFDYGEISEEDIENFRKDNQDVIDDINAKRSFVSI